MKEGRIQEWCWWDQRVEIIIVKWKFDTILALDEKDGLDKNLIIIIGSNNI